MPVDEPVYALSLDLPALSLWTRLGRLGTDRRRLLHHRRPTLRAGALAAPRGPRGRRSSGESLDDGNLPGPGRPHARSYGAQPAPWSPGVGRAHRQLPVPAVG